MKNQSGFCSRVVWFSGFLLSLMVTQCCLNETLAKEPDWLGEPLTWEGDLASQMIDGIDKFLLRKTEEAVGQRRQHWNYDTSSVEAYNKSIQPNRERLAHMLGLRDQRVSLTPEEWKVVFDQKREVARGKNYTVYEVRWPVLLDPDPNRNAIASVTAEGLLLLPDQPNKDDLELTNMIYVPHADETPEFCLGMEPGNPVEGLLGNLQARLNHRVLIPTLISYEMKSRNGRAHLTNREYVHRSAFELGRHILGYELQKIFAGIDFLSALDAAESDEKQKPSIGINGRGEGGMLALLAGALDERIDGTIVEGFWGPQETMWQAPVNRNIFGFLNEFGTAELAMMVMPRKLYFVDSYYPELEVPSNGGAPGELRLPTDDEVVSVLKRFKQIKESVTKIPDRNPFYIRRINPNTERSNNRTKSKIGDNPLNRKMFGFDPPKVTAPLPNTEARQQRQLEEIDRHNQLLLREAPYVRAEYMKGLDTSSLETYEKSVEHYRELFRKDVIGEFDEERLPLNPRTRIKYETEEYTGYEVVLDVFEDVFAYGILLLPTDIKEGDRRPVVVCQHGLEGRPTDTIENDHRAYHDYAAELAKRGFVVFAPQNPYLFKDRFRTLQRKANPLGKTLFSIIVPQHEAITDWLASLQYVDESRIGFYGLSYGGKSAMRIPALVDRYCLSICSADFNEWVLKNASTRDKYSYVWTGEYEIFEWDLGSTFNYAEMAALIAPRPFMVERGHFDGVAPDEWVGYEFAKVRNLYQARLGIGDRCEIEWFVGPHMINGQGTFKFLSKHLDWPIESTLGE